MQPEDVLALPRVSPQSELLEALAARCEREDVTAGTVAAFLLDGTITKAVHPEYGAEGTSSVVAKVLPYTTSLDAAVTLVPEGFVWGVEDFCGNAARVIGPEDDKGNVPDGYSDTADVKTPALALCAAALRARAAIAKQTEAPDTRGKAHSNPLSDHQKLPGAA